MIQHIFIPNRGEVVTRIARTCSRLGIKFSVFDSPKLEDFLDKQRLVRAAREQGADAVHPGWGFLSEDAEFAQTVIGAGLTWIGPNPQAMKSLGDKAMAKKEAQRMGIPVLDAIHDPGDDAKFLQQCQAMGFPLLLKPVAGGGGKGMLRVENHGEFKEKLSHARLQAQSAFGNPLVMAEKFLTHARHVEIQILGDSRGNIHVLGERDCTLQRRSQKIIEEAPSLNLDPAQRADIYKAARDLAGACKYQNAGTVEFILDGKKFYFMEVNTRLQVEHGVTEMLYNVDLIEQQIRVARDESLDHLKYVTPSGHVIQVRIYSEDPTREFLPTTGEIFHLNVSQAADVRIDSGITVGSKVSSAFDPMLMKVIAKADTRNAAIAKLRETLASLELYGVITNINFLQWALTQPDFLSGKHHTRWAEENLNTFTHHMEKQSPPELLVSLARYLTEENTAISQETPWLKGKSYV